MVQTIRQAIDLMTQNASEYGYNNNWLSAIGTYRRLTNDFGLGYVSAGPCLLYARACNISDRELVSTNLLSKHSIGASKPFDDDDGEPEAELLGSGREFILVPWYQRSRQSLGLGSSLI
jgi:hypothetical protein